MPDIKNIKQAHETIQMPEIKNIKQAYETIERNFFKASIYLLSMAKQKEMLIRIDIDGLDTIVQFTNVILDQENLTEEGLSYEYAFRINGKHMDIAPFFKTLINLKKARQFMIVYLEFWDNFIRNKLQQTVAEAAMNIANFDTYFYLACENIFTPIAWLEKDIVEIQAGPGGRTQPPPTPPKRKDIGRYIPEPIQKIIGQPPEPDTRYNEGGVKSVEQETPEEEEPGSAGQITEKQKKKKTETPTIEESGEEGQEQQEGSKTKEKEKQKKEKEWKPPEQEREEGEGRGSGKGEGEEGEGEGGGEEEEKIAKIKIDIKELKKLIEKRAEWREE